MIATTERRAFSGSEKNDRGRAGRRRQILQLGVALALTLATVASAQSYQVLKNFSGSDGEGPCGGLVLSGSTLYGTTVSGGSPGNYGVVFKVNTDGSGYAVLKNFTGGDGAYPEASLVLAGSTVYGTTEGGGSSGAGVVFRMNTDGSGYMVLKNITESDGGNPFAGLVLGGSTLYGTTSYAGVGNGVVFKVNTDGSGYAVLKNFTGGSDGGWPFGGLVLAGSSLYGTAYRGGSWDDGVVFKVNTDGSGYAVLKNFTGGSDGEFPWAGLVMAGSTLYGTTYQGGAGGCGVVFKVNTDGSGYAALKNFSGISGGDGALLYAGLVLAGSTLYGTTTYGGGSSDDGVVFEVNTDGSGYAALKNFTGGSDGANPQASLVLAGGGLYGTTYWGGSYGHGVVFSVAIPLSITAPPLTQTAEAGSTVGFRVKAEPPVPGLAYQWFFGGTHALVGATNALLELTNVQPVQAGAYQVVVTSLGLSVTSTPALLSVIPPVDRTVVPAVSLTGSTGSFLHLEYTNDLVAAAPQWFSLSNVTLGSGPQFCFDLSQPLPAQRFYRTWQTNVLSVKPALQMSLATEITLTGAIGSNVRVDRINQFGPTDAWVTLNTVLLTNTTQLYFDVTASRQPTRLYRLVAIP
jgi:uncharacterized repeat protein (TIGR03803 family)